MLLPWAHLTLNILHTINLQTIVYNGWHPGVVLVRYGRAERRQPPSERQATSFPLPSRQSEPSLTTRSAWSDLRFAALLNRALINFDVLSQHEKIPIQNTDKLESLTRRN